MIDTPNLIQVCRTLNRYGVIYAVSGGYACALNGHVRMTEDIDILLRDDNENLLKAIEAIHELFPNTNEEISPSDIRDNIVLKIIEDIEVDFSIKAWSVDYKEAQNDIQHIQIEGVMIPYLGVDSLIKSKQTFREIDQWDIKVLQELKRKKH